jgi:hypothetical protein
VKVLADSLEEPYPRVIIVGDANEGGEPEKNQVSVEYFYDPSGACYLGDAVYCPTEDVTADFDGDGLADMDIARLPVRHKAKVLKAVENFVNKVSVATPTERALFTVGDYEWQGVSPEGLPELMDDLIGDFASNGYEIRYMRETDYPRWGLEERQLDLADSLNEGVDIVINTGTLSNRSRIAGDFIQKIAAPKWNMSWLDDTGPRPFVFFGPGCDMGDFDRDNPHYDPILAEMFLCNEPMKPAAVAWISHGRGNWATWYKIFALEFVDWLFSGETTDLLDCYWRTKRDCWGRYPEMRRFLKSVFYLGWPVKIRGNCEAGVERNKEMPAQVSLAVLPNPGRNGVTVRFGLPAGGRVRMAVYDVMGRCVLEVVNGRFDPGWHSVAWRGNNSSGERVSPGMYFVRLSAGGMETTRKAMLVR